MAEHVGHLMETGSAANHLQWPRCGERHVRLDASRRCRHAVRPGGRCAIWRRWSAVHTEHGTVKTHGGGERVADDAANTRPTLGRLAPQAAESAPDEICRHGSGADLQPSKYLPNLATQLRQPGARVAPEATTLLHCEARSVWSLDTQPALD